MDNVTARSLMRDFPGWLCWYGTATGAWWAMPPSGLWYPQLVEAATPGELANRIRAVGAAGHRAA